jgi:hypothetical protein
MATKMGWATFLEIFHKLIWSHCLVGVKINKIVRYVVRFAHQPGLSPTFGLGQGFSLNKTQSPSPIGLNFFK